MTEHEEEEAKELRELRIAAAVYAPKVTKATLMYGHYDASRYRFCKLARPVANDRAPEYLCAIQSYEHPFEGEARGRPLSYFCLACGSSVGAGPADFCQNLNCLRRRVTFYTLALLAPDRPYYELLEALWEDGFAYQPTEDMTWGEWNAV